MVDTGAGAAGEHWTDARQPVLITEFRTDPVKRPHFYLTLTTSGYHELLALRHTAL